MKYESLYARLVANTHEPENDQACWIWKGPTRRHAGGHRPAICIRVDGKPRQHNAARVMLDQFEGFADPAHGASHLCSDNWLCVNPDHLISESHRDNIGRRDGRDVPLPAVRERADTDPDMAAGVVSSECPF